MRVFTVNFRPCESIRVKFLVPYRAQSVYAHTQVGTALHFSNAGCNWLRVYTE